MSAFTDALYRLTQYNDGPYNASNNPHGFDNQGYVINLPQCTEDIATVCGGVADAADTVAQLSTEIEALGAIASEIDIVAGQIGAVTTLAGISAAISTLAGIVSAISTVATNAAAVANVSSNIAAVTAVNGALANINSVAGALTNIATVLTHVAAINTTAGSIANVNLVAGSIGNVNSVAGALTNIATVIANITNINTLAPRASDMALLADIQDGTLATNAITVVAANVTPLQNVASNIGSLQSVAGALSDVQTVAGIATPVATVAAAQASIGTVAANIVAVSSVSTNMSAILAVPSLVTAAEAARDAARRVTRYVEFDDSTTDADPGNGLFRLSFAPSATPGTAGTLYIDLLDSYGTTITSWIESWDDVLNDITRGEITLIDATQPANTMTLRVTGGVTTATGYRKVPVTVLARGGTWADGALFSINFSPAGADGNDGEGAGNVNPTGSITAGRLVRFADGTGNVIEDSGINPADLVVDADLAPFFNKGTDTLDAIAEGATNKQFTATLRTKLNGIADGADVTNTTSVGSALNAAAAKTTPVDADLIVGLDSAASFVPKKFSWANIKATLKTYFDGLYAAIGHSHAAVVSAGASGFMIGSDKLKLDGIASGATANATDADLRDRSTHTGTQAAATITGLSTVATTGAYADLSGKPTLGTAAAANSGDFATAAQGGKADTALQAAAIGVTVQGYDADTAKTDVAQTWSAAQQFGQVTGTATAVAALQLNCALGNEFSKTIAANSTFTVTGVPATGKAYHLRLILTYTSGTITWFSGVNWVKGTAPTFTGGKVYEIIFSTENGGTTWRGAAAEFNA